MSQYVRSINVSLFPTMMTSSNENGDVVMGTIATQITSLTVVYSSVYSDADQGKHQSSASLAFVWEIHRGPVNSPHKWPVTRKMFPFDDVIMHRPKIFNIPPFSERLARQVNFMFNDPIIVYHLHVSYINQCSWFIFLWLWMDLRTFKNL